MKQKRFKVEQIVAVLKQAEAGVPHVELIRRVGISQGYLSEMERGNKEIGAEVLLWVSRESGKSIEWLLTGKRPQGIASGFRSWFEDWIKNVLVEGSEVLTALSLPPEERALRVIPARPCFPQVPGCDREGKPPSSMGRYP